MLALEQPKFWQIRQLGAQPYQLIWQKMRAFTDAREADTQDEIWLLEHFPVYTQGIAGKAEHILNPNGIEVVQIDRGGQVTYHGLGQLIVYVLLDIKRAQVGVRALVSMLENSVVALLKAHGVEGYARADAPGVYVGGEKIASLGLKIRRGCSYHGLALNVAMDLAPFEGINPCGLRAMRMTQLRDLGIELSVAQAGQALCEELARQWQGLKR